MRPKKKTPPALLINPEPAIHHRNLVIQSQVERISINTKSEIEFLDECLGSGYFSKVFKAFHRASGTPLAIKQVPLLSNEDSKIRIEREIRTICSCNSPNVVYAYLAYTTPLHAFIVMEFADKGTLKSAFAHSPQLTEAVISELAWHVLSGLLYLNKNHICHRDLKPSNLLLFSDGLVKIADFGVSSSLKSTNATMSTNTGTLLYMAPERISGTKYKRNTDIWSLGIILVECFIGRHPFADEAEVSDVFELRSILDQDSSRWIPSGISEDFRNFLEQCLTSSPNDRPRAEQLLAHQFIVNRPCGGEFLAWISGLPLLFTS